MGKASKSNKRRKKDRDLILSDDSDRNNGEERKIGEEDLSDNSESEEKSDIEFEKEISKA